MGSDEEEKEEKRRSRKYGGEAMERWSDGVMEERSRHEEDGLCGKGRYGTQRPGEAVGCGTDLVRSGTRIFIWQCTP